jgi:hypothetical protein
VVLAVIIVTMVESLYVAVRLVMLTDALQLITILVMSGVRKEIIKMTGKEYVELAMRTNDGNATGRIEKAIELLHRPDKPK